MNLYDYSQVNNDEMAIYFTKNENEALYSSIKKEVFKLCKSFSEAVPVDEKRNSGKRTGLEPGKNMKKRSWRNTFPLSVLVEEVLIRQKREISFFS